MVVFNSYVKLPEGRFPEDLLIVLEFLYILDIMGIHQCLLVFLGHGWIWMDMDGYGRT